MKKYFFSQKKATIKVAKLNRTYIEHVIFILIGALLITNLILSLKILFG